MQRARCQVRWHTNTVGAWKLQIPVANEPSREHRQGLRQERNRPGDPRALPKQLEMSLRLQNLTGREAGACSDGHVIYRAWLQQEMRCLQDMKESIQLRSQALEESSVTEEGLPGSPQTGLASDKMPIDRRQRCCTSRTRGHGFAGIKSPGAGRHTLLRLGRYCSSNCSAPVTRRAKGTSLKAVPRDAFQNPPP